MFVQIYYYQLRHKFYPIQDSTCNKVWFMPTFYWMSQWKMLVSNSYSNAWIRFTNVCLYRNWKYVILKQNSFPVFTLILQGRPCWTSCNNTKTVPFVTWRKCLKCHFIRYLQQLSLSATFAQLQESLMMGNIQMLLIIQDYIHKLLNVNQCPNRVICL